MLAPGGAVAEDNVTLGPAIGFGGTQPTAPTDATATTSTAIATTHIAVGMTVRP
jgi:hypothetical protein